MTDLSLMTAAELVAGYQDRTFSPVDATQAALDAIDARDDRVHAFVLVDRESALASARAAEKRWHEGNPIGPADGVPTSIKDILLTKGWPTLRGTRLIDESGPWDDDAPAVARLREAGAVFLGKTATPEFAWKGVTDSAKNGVTGNPWGADLTAGGSSGGSAAAVGLGMGTWSVGTDGGGSVRIPAAFTGTVGFKPTYGLVPTYPASPFGTLSHAGPMTRSVIDAAAMLDVLTGFDSRDWSAMPTPLGSFASDIDGGVVGLRVAFSPDLGYVANDPEVEQAVRAAVDVLSDAGADITEVNPGFEDPLEAFNVLWFAGAAMILQPYADQDLDDVDPGLREAAEIGRGSTALDYVDANSTRVALGVTMGQFHQDYDLLVTPTMPIPAFTAGQAAPDGWASQQWTSWTPYTFPFNMTQQPALSVPCGFTSTALPVGLQVVGPRHADALVLRAGQAYERSTNWRQRRPTEL